MDWGAIFVGLSETYGFTPKEIGELTFVQLRRYLQGSSGKKDKGRPVTMRDLKKIISATRGDE